MGGSSGPNSPPLMSDGNASFLRAARSGNIDKVTEYLKGSIDINVSNANGLNALHLSSKEGHLNVVLELLKKGADVNIATKKGNTALHIASLAGQEDIVKVLIRNGADVNVQSQNGFTPLYMAAQENHDNVVKFLLAHGANQGLATEDGFTPLAVALQQGHDKVVAVLLENDAKGRVRLPALHIAAKKDDCKAAALLLQNDHDPDVTSKSGFTPLHIAAHYGNENIGRLLLEKNADVNFSAKHQITPLHVAAKWGKSNMVTLLLHGGGKIDASTRDGLTPLHCAARSGHDQVVDLLLERGAPITAKTKNGLAPLHMASQGDHVDSARILLYHKAPVDDVTVDYLTALHVAAHCGHVRVAKLLLDRKADPNARALNGFTPLHIACKKNRIKVVELLLKHGASIEATTESGLTPLHVASFMGCMNIVIYLIQHGANPDVPTVRGETPLHLAARANQSDIIRILLRNGAHVDASAREQQTPLHIAARLGNVDIVGLLLQHGATVDATTKDMYTALHIAAKEGQEEVASVLLDHGASLTATTKKGFTPLHLAAKYGNIKVARLLLQKDAPVDSQGKNGVTPLHVAAHYDHVNVALLLLDKGAYPHATAKNGYTPLHIAAKKNQMDIATTLLEYGAKPNAESKAGFSPIHLAAQEGHTDMTTLLIEHHADVNSAAKNGLTPLHLCAQEDRVNVAAILVKNGADVGPPTKAGYTPLHVACHFGQTNMIRFLLQHGADVNATTTHGYTPLHQAAQQGHTLIINLLLEHKASPNTTTSLGQTALSIAQRLGYVSVVETLKIVTETVVTTTTTTVTEEKYKVVAPETMQETFMSDSEDEGGDDIEDTSLYGKPAHATHVYLPYIEGQRLLMTEDTMLGDQSFRYLTADEMKSLGDDSLPIDVTGDERGLDAMLSAPLTAEEDHLTPQHVAHQEAFSSTQVDNVELARAPVHAGFLVSFMVDARGGAMRGCRHSGVRVIIPPRKAPMPMRITCRYLRKEKLAYPPPLMEGEACASRILEVGPAGAKFLGPVIIEVPHFAALRGREREITILRSDNGESWREHSLEASDDAVHDVFNESFEGEELTALDDLNTNRITRILTTDFPQYFAIITRIRQEVHAIGPEGGMVSSTVVPQVQAIFPEGALTKKIKVGLQAQPITPELVAKMLGNRVAVSPIVTVEPRRRKFHKPITLTIPVPQAATKGMINQYSGDAPTLRLLCSITGGTTKAQWEDVTGSTPLTFVNDCVSFTTTVSARFWLMDCRQVNEATKFATELYREAIHVPFMAKFVVFAKRHDPLEAQLRVFCMTDDKEDKTLESQEHFTEVAKSRDVEVLEVKHQYLEFAGNLVPVTKSGEQLSLTFQAFRENRLPFTIRVKDPHQEPLGRVAFMREQRVGRGEPPQIPICNLNIVLPEARMTPVSELVTLEKKYGFVEETGLANPELIHRADLRLTDIAKELKDDWVPLALQLDVPETDINSIRSECPDSVSQQAIVMLRHWLQRAGTKATGNSLEKALRKINREDIVNQCMFNVELVTDDVEKAVAKVHLDQSGFDAFKEELGSSRDASLRRDASLNGTLDDRDIMKEAESAAETSSESSDKEAHFKVEPQEEQMEEEIEEEIIIRETVDSPEETLIGQDSKMVPEEPSEPLSREISNGNILESGFQREELGEEEDEEKSEPIVTTVYSEVLAETAFLPAEEEKPEKETHVETKEWTETDESGQVKQVTQIKTETSIKVVGDSELGEGCSDEALSFVEKRNFFQRLSLTSETLPATCKWTQEVSMDDIPMAEGEIIKEQISFEDKFKMFEPDEDSVRRRIQKNGNQGQQTVYRYDFTKSDKEKPPASDSVPSELDKAEAIVKRVTDELNSEEHLSDKASSSPPLSHDFMEQSGFTLETVENEVSVLLAEVAKEEKHLSGQADVLVENISSFSGKPSQAPLSEVISEIHVDKLTGRAKEEIEDHSMIETASFQAKADEKNFGFGETVESESAVNEMLLSQELVSVAPDSLREHSEVILDETYEVTFQTNSLLDAHAICDPLCEETLQTQTYSNHKYNVVLESRRVTLLAEEPSDDNVKLSTQSDKDTEYRLEKFREALELEDDEKSTLSNESERGKPPGGLPLQKLDISAVVKSQILDEELGQSIEDSPLEVKHIAEELEKSDMNRESKVYKHIKTEIFSQQLSEDIESGSPERKDISPVTQDLNIDDFASVTSPVPEDADEIRKSGVMDQGKEEIDISPVIEDNALIYAAEHIEHDDLEEYEEAKDELSLSEQLRALASNVSPSFQCMDEDDFMDHGMAEECFKPDVASGIAVKSAHEAMDNCRKSKDPRLDKKEIRSLKSTKQVSTIEEHSSIESSDSPLEHLHQDFNEGWLKMEVPVEILIASSDSHVIPENAVITSDARKELEEYQEQDATSSENFVQQEKDETVDFSEFATKEKSALDKPSDVKPLSHPKVDKPPKDDKKSDSDSEGKKAPCVAELLPPAKKDESFSSSGEIESHYFSVETSDSGKSPRSTPAGSRPCSSEFEINVLSGQGSEYETCATSQDTTGEISGSYATAATSQETSYSTACSSLSHSSRESAYSVDSESSGNLASVEVSSEASETLVPSAQEMELEFGLDLEMPVLDEESASPSLLREPYDMEIPESVIRSGVELPFMQHWGAQTMKSDEIIPQTGQWAWKATSESPENLNSYQEFELAGPSNVNLERTSTAADTSMLPETDESGKDAFGDEQTPCVTTHSTGSTICGDSSKSSSSEPDNDNAQPMFHPETQCLKHLPEISQEVEDVDGAGTSVDDERLLLSDSSAAHSEQTWQTSSVDTAVQLSGHASASCVMQETQSTVSYTDSMSDGPADVDVNVDHVPVQQPYLQLNGPIEIEFDAEYDAFDGAAAAGLAENHNLPDELQFELEDEIPHNHHALNGNLSDDHENDAGTDVNGFGAAGIAQQIRSDPPSSRVARQCPGTFAEAEKPEAQQQQLSSYQDDEDRTKHDSIAMQYQTSYLPESDQCNLSCHTSETAELESPSPEKENASGTVSNATNTSEKVESHPQMHSSDSIDKADVVDTSPEDERYDFQLQKTVALSEQIATTSDAFAKQSDITVDGLESVHVIEDNKVEDQILPTFSPRENVPPPKPCSQPEGEEHDEFELKESDMFPSPLPEDDKQSTPSYEGQKFFPRSGETSAASSLQEFERLEAEFSAGRCSQASADSYDKIFRSGEASDVARRFVHRSGESSAASSLQEFERLEAEMAAGRFSRLSADSVEKAATGKSSERDDASMCSLTDFEKLEKEYIENEQAARVSADLKLSEIHEVPESQTSEASHEITHELTSEVSHDHDSEDSDYEKRMSEIEEIIKIAETNVEKFHEEVVEDLSEGVTFEEYTVTCSSETSVSRDAITTRECINDTSSKDHESDDLVDEAGILGDSMAAETCGDEGHDSSSNSSKNGKGDCMVSSTDSVDPSSSTATHATYQFETDSVMSSSINSAQASGEECTMVSSTDTLEPETKITYSQGDLTTDESHEACGGIMSESSHIQVSTHEYSAESGISGYSLKDVLHQEIFVTGRSEESLDPDADDKLHQKDSDFSVPPASYPDLLHHSEFDDHNLCSRRNEQDETHCGVILSGS